MAGGQSAGLNDIGVGDDSDHSTGCLLFPFSRARRTAAISRSISRMLNELVPLRLASRRAALKASEGGAMGMHVVLNANDDDDRLSTPFNPKTLFPLPSPLENLPQLIAGGNRGDYVAHRLIGLFNHNLPKRIVRFN
jgi:hypothetical protein